VSRSQIGNLFSWSPNDEIHNKVAARQLEALIDAGLVERHEPPSCRYQHLYSLTHDGTYVADTVRGKFVRRPRSPFPSKLLKPERLGHHLDLVSTGVAFANKRINEGYGELSEWEQESVEYKFSWLGSRHVIRPDARFLWWTGDGELFPVHVELHGENPTKTVVEKIKKYCYFQVSGSYRTETLTPAPVLIVSRHRLVETMGKAVIQAVLKSRLTIPKAAQELVVGVAKLESLIEEGPFGRVWYLPLQAVAEASFSDVLELSLKSETYPFSGTSPESGDYVSQKNTNGSLDGFGG